MGLPLPCLTQEDEGGGPEGELSIGMGGRDQPGPGVSGSGAWT